MKKKTPVKKAKPVPVMTKEEAEFEKEYQAAHQRLLKWRKQQLKPRPIQKHKKQVQ